MTTSPKQKYPTSFVALWKTMWAHTPTCTHTMILGIFVYTNVYTDKSFSKSVFLFMPMHALTRDASFMLMSYYTHTNTFIPCVGMQVHTSNTYNTPDLYVCMYQHPYIHSLSDQSSRLLTRVYVELH